MSEQQKTAVAACAISISRAPVLPALLHVHSAHWPSSFLQLTQVLGSVVAQTVVSRLLHAPRPEPVGIVGLLSWPGSVWPLASHGCPSSVTAASTGRSGWSWLEPQLR